MSDVAVASAFLASDTVAMTPLLVLLPGLDGSKHLFEPLLREWSGDAIVVSYPTSLPSDYRALLPFVLQVLPQDRDFVILGWSFSGPLALLAAASEPAGLRGVVLCASFVEKPIAWVPTFARHFCWPPLFGLTGSLALAKTVLAGHGSKEVNALIRRAHDAVPSPVMAARVRQVLTVDVSEELRGCSVPILYLAAESDRVVPLRNANRIRKLQPDVQVRSIAGPHIALATNPSAAADELREFAAHCLTS